MCFSLGISHISAVLENIGLDKFLLVHDIMQDKDMEDENQSQKKKVFSKLRAEAESSG